VQVKKDREVDVDIRRKDRKYIISRLFILRRYIVRLMRFLLIARDRPPLQCKNQQYFSL